MAPSSSGGGASCLPIEVQNAIASLPEKDRQVFTYIALHEFTGVAAAIAAGSSNSKSPWQASSSSSSSTSSAKKKGGGRSKNTAAATRRRNSDHTVAFTCDCMECWIDIYKMLGESPNAQVMHEALGLNDAAAAEEAAAKSKKWSMGKRRGAKNRGRNSSPMEDSRGDSSPQDDDRKKKNRKDLSDEKTAKPRSKQVAPLDDDPSPEDEEHTSHQEQIPHETIIVHPPPSNEGDDQHSEYSDLDIDSTGKPLGSRISETLGFLFDRLVGMWYPRIRRGPST